MRISRRNKANALAVRRSLRLQRGRSHLEVTSNKSEVSSNGYVDCSTTTTKREKEEENDVEARDEREEICDDENYTILPFCEANISYDDEEAPCADEDDGLVQLNEDNGVNDVFGDYFTEAIPEATQCFQCKICRKVYNNALAFESHVVAEHGTGIDNSDDLLEKLTLYRVSRGTSFYTRVKRNHDARRNNDASHVTSSFETKSNVLSCSQCDYKSPSKRSLAVHVAKHVENGKFACETCGRSFKIHGELIHHIRLCHREQNHICGVCGKIYRGAKTLSNHRKFVHFGGKYECKVCGRLLASQKYLDSHVAKVHIEKKKVKTTKNFVCDACGKVFPSRWQLKMHMSSVHNGEKPYVCAICKESFAKRNSLRQHLILHTGAKPYVCDICGKAFAQKPGLTGHRKSHPGQHPPLPPVYIDSIIADVLAQCKQ